MVAKRSYDLRRYIAASLAFTFVISVAACAVAEEDDKQTKAEAPKAAAEHGAVAEPSDSEWMIIALPSQKR